MRSKLVITSLLTSGLLAFACSNQEFSAGGKSSAAVGKGKPGNGKVTAPSTTSSTNQNSNGLNPDDGGQVKLVDAELTISKSSDGAAWKNCLYAGIQGQPLVEIGCNRESPRGNRLEQKSTTIKLKTNECNQLILALYTQRPGEAAPTPNLDTTNKVSRFQIKKAGPRKFEINANDNFDNDWHDLNVTISANSENIKFTIENSGIPCD